MMQTIKKLQNKVKTNENSGKIRKNSKIGKNWDMFSIFLLSGGKKLTRTNQ